MVVYRIGTPFTSAERDSLRGPGIDLEVIAWSHSLWHDALELDSLRAGSLQPNFLDEDEDIPATLVSRGGWVAADIGYYSRDSKFHVLVDGDPAAPDMARRGPCEFRKPQPKYFGGDARSGW